MAVIQGILSVKYALTMDIPQVAVVGGGQLARMMQEAANALGIHLRVLVESPQASAAQVTPDSPVGSPQNPEEMWDLIKDCDVLTFEHEHQNDEILCELGKQISIQPAPEALLLARDKIQMRKKLTELNIPCPRWRQVSSLMEIKEFGDEIGWPIIIKTARGGYDGKGVGVLNRVEDAQTWLDSGADLLVEEKVPFESELAALVARNPSGEIKTWPVVTTVQKEGICSEVIYPAQIPPEAITQAENIAKQIASEIKVTGVMAVEMFAYRQADQTKVVVNELAMRPHNSGHWTIEGSLTSQFEQHLRAVLDLPLGETTPTAPVSVMVNLLGNDTQDPRRHYQQVMQTFPQAKIHYYGKESRPGRKLGHVTVVGADLDAVRQQALAAVEILRNSND